MVAASGGSLPLPPGHAPRRDPVEVLAFQRGDDRYVWLFRRDQVSLVFNSLGRFASDPELNLTWHDAAELAAKLTPIAYTNGGQHG